MRVPVRTSLSIYAVPFRDTVLRFYEQFSYEPYLHPKHPKCLYSTLLPITPAEDAAEIYTEQF